ncbi:MAG: MT-A70 family methyltransferase [bacterium]
MSRCIAFYKKCEEQGADWCEKLPHAVRLIENYLDLCKELESRGVPKELTMVNMTERAARPLFSLREPEIREKAMEKITSRLNGKRGAGRGNTKKLTSGDVRGIIQMIKHEEKKPLPTPAGQYSVILADPPWRYEFSETGTREIENQYPTMDLEEIKALKVPAADDAILLLWTTAPKLEESLEVLNAWGFTYRTCAIWDKEKKGMGYWFRIQHELLLVGIKGNFKTPDPENRFDSVIRSPREGHSEKPACVYTMIERMFPEQSRIELFARTNREGWAAWGNEV